MTRYDGDIHSPANVPISVKRGVMFWGLLPGSPARRAGADIPVTFRCPPPTNPCIEVIPIASVFAGTAHQTFVLKS